MVDVLRIMIMLADVLSDAKGSIATEIALHLPVS